MQTTRKLTYREARYVSARLRGDVSQAQAAREAGFPAWMCESPGRELERGEVAALIAELQGTLAEHAVEASLIDAAEIHEYLTECIRAKRSDIQNPDHTYKPLDEWPEIWQRMAEDGDVVVRRRSERSHDGETLDKPGGWDETGDEIISVRYKFGRKAELLKLAMQHRGVDAMVPRVPVETERDININITWQTAEDKTAQDRVIDVTPVTPERGKLSPSQ